MKFISYNREFNIATKQFADVFNNIRIKRWNGQSLQKTIHVPCVYGNRSRILKSLENRNKTLQLPMISFNKTSLVRDTARVHSVNDGLFFSGNGFNLNENMAVPMNLEFEVSIITKYESDLDQIISNFIAMMNPDIYVSWPNPKGQGNIKSQVIWEGDISIEYPEDIGETEPERIIATANFTYKTWIFPGEGLFDNNPENSLGNGGGGRIEHINLCEGEPISGNFDIPGADIGTGQKWNRWYDVPSYMSVDEYCENVAAGLISDGNYDEIGVLPEISGGYYAEVFGVSGTTIYSTRDPEDLEYLINNYNNIQITMLTQDSNFFYPEHLVDFDWVPIWERMLSGDLSGCFVNNVTTQYWLSNEDPGLYFILYEDGGPIRLEITT
jgi:hypothetical protein